MFPRRDGYSYALGRPIGADRDFLAQGRRRHKIETMHLFIRHRTGYSWVIQPWKKLFTKPTIISVQPLLKKYRLAPATLVAITGYLQEKTCRCARTPSSIPLSFMFQAWPITGKERAISNPSTGFPNQQNPISKDPPQEGGDLKL